MPSREQMQRTVIAVGLLVLISLSGCAGLSDTNSSTPSTVESTASPPSTVEPTASPPSVTDPTTSNKTLPNQFPAGLTDAGVGNVTKVIRAHQEAVIKTPGVVTHVTDTGTSNISINASVRVAAVTNLTRVQYVAHSQRRTANGTQNSTTVIAANETSVRQYTVTGEVVMLDNRRNRTELFDRALRGLSAARNPLQGTLQRGNFTVTSGGNPDDTTAIMLRADQYAGGQRYNAQNIVAYNATVRITGNGLIHSATERIVAGRNNNKRQYNFTYEFNSRSVTLPRVPQVPKSIQLNSATASDS